MLSSSGDFDCRVTLDREGPIYDFAWSPNSKEFCVVYGCKAFRTFYFFNIIPDAIMNLDMPAKTMLFDQGVRVLNDFGSSPHNFISYNPQGRLMALAGFGSLAGKIDIICRRSLTKVCSIDAPNTTYCEWSPDGRYLLTAILSPRLRVDNGIKIWHCTGPLVHIQSTEELYQVSWRPIPVTACPPFGPSLPPAPEPSESVRNNVDALKHMTPTKAAGAYRPPGARGLATPAFFKREDEGGEPRMPTNGAATPPRVYNRTVPGAAVNGNGVGGGQNGIMNGRRHVPGAANSSAQGSEGDKKNNRKRKGGKDGRKEGGSIGTGAEIVAAVEKVQAAVVQQMTNGRELIGLGMNGLHVPEEPSTPVLGGEGLLDPIAKKIRNLNKKVSLSFGFSRRAIDGISSCIAQGDRGAEGKGTEGGEVGSDSVEEDGRGG
jgi:translation initiation factor 2A